MSKPPFQLGVAKGLRSGQWAISVDRHILCHFQEVYRSSDKTDEMSQKLHSSLYQLACGEVGLVYVISFKVVEPIDDIE